MMQIQGVCRVYVLYRALIYATSYTLELIKFAVLPDCSMCITLYMYMYLHVYYYNAWILSTAIAST